MKLSRVIFFIALFGAAFWLYRINYWQVMGHQNIKLSGKSGREISADLYAVNSPKGWLLMAHSMPETKESWNIFASDMQKFGYESLAFDLSGYGESDGGPDGYIKFSKEDHQAGIYDLETAWDYLKSRGASSKKTAVIGGSIGANLSLLFLTEHPEISGGVLLSAGDYQGINSAELVKKLNADQKLLLAASKLDERSAGNNSEQNAEYYNLASQVKNRHLILFEGKGHATELFNLKEEYNLEEAIIKFLEIGKIN